MKRISEAEPNGIDQHAPGTKLDSGKVKVSLLFNDFPRALLAVAKIATFGADKYSEGGWLEVQDGIKRYDNAKNRHILYGAIDPVDDESGMLHLAHECWNALAKLELTLREEESKNGIR